MSDDPQPHVLRQLLARLAEPAPAQSVLRTELAGGQFAQAVLDLADLVGGIDALEALSTDPLPAETIAASGVGGGLGERIEAVGAAINAFAARYTFIDVPDAEFRTVIARLVRRIVDGAPDELARSAPARVGAALVWLAMQGNGELGRRARLPATFIWDGFGVGPAGDLGRRLLRATGLPFLADPSAAGTSVWLADVTLLHSRTRRRLVARRDGLVRMLDELAARRREQAPLRLADDGRVAMQGHRTMPHVAVRGADAGGRDMVAMVFGTAESDVEVLAVSVPDAHRLVQMLQQALATNVDRLTARSTS